MRLLAILLASSLCLPFVACSGSSDEESYDTFQLCFEDHHVAESLSVHDSIVVCCVDHPIAGVHPSCGDTAAACQALLGGTDSVHNLSSASATPAEVMMSCADYITQKNM